MKLTCCNPWVNFAYSIKNIQIMNHSFIFIQTIAEFLMCTTMIDTQKDGFGSQLQRTSGVIEETSQRTPL